MRLYRILSTPLPHNYHLKSFLLYTLGNAELKHPTSPRYLLLKRRRVLPSWVSVHAAGIARISAEMLFA